MERMRDNDKVCTVLDFSQKAQKIMKKKYVIIFATLLALYTAVIVLIYVLNAPVTKSKNNAYMRSYKNVVLSERDKAALFARLGVDLARLETQGYPLASVDFLAPADYPKEVHAVELGFENIYCQAQILCHDDEVGWEREISNDACRNVELGGLTFAYAPSTVRKGGTLKFDDTAHDILYVFDCSQDLGSELYLDFLQAFFGSGAAKR